MFHFIGSIFSGIAYVGAVLLSNFGLIAIPVLPKEKPATAAIVQQVPAAGAPSEVDVIKQEVESLKKELAEIKKPKPAPAPAPKPAPVSVQAPVPVPAPIPVPVPVPTSQVSPSTFVTPSGSVVDAQGNLISAPPNNATPSPSTSSSTPSSAPASTPTPGSTVSIARYIAVAVEFNPSSSCKELSFGGQELKLCELYKDSKNSYTWVLTD